MDANTAREILAAYAERKPSEIGKAVDVLYKEFGTYRALAQQFGRSGGFWGIRHRIFQLPVGIRWKIDEGQIGITHGEEICRLKDEEDQWLLALAIIETKDLSAKECENVVNLVLKEDKSIREALSVSAGIRFDKSYPLLLPLPFDIRLAICRRAWNQCEDWANFCYQLVRQGIDVDIREVAQQLEKLTSDLRKAGQEENR